MSLINGIPISHTDSLMFTALIWYPPQTSDPNSTWSFHPVSTQTHCFPFSSYLVMWSPFPLSLNLPWEALLFLTSVPFPSSCANSEIKTKFARNTKLICQLTFLPPVRDLTATPRSTLNSIGSSNIFCWALQISPHPPRCKPLHIVFIHNASDRFPLYTLCIQLPCHHFYYIKSLVF